MQKTILLPGLNKQLELLLDNLDVTGLKVLVIGSSSEAIATQLVDAGAHVEIIVEDFDSLINARLVLKNDDRITIKLMRFDNTDYPLQTFDLVYAQGTISLTNRNKIVKELGRIIKSQGHLCVGEIVTTGMNIPAFARDIFNASNLLPMYSGDIIKYYNSKGFNRIADKDLTYTLKEYYSYSLKKLELVKKNMTKQEVSYYKKLLNRISHESKAYLSQGLDKYTGFAAYLFTKSN